MEVDACPLDQLADMIGARMASDGWTRLPLGSAMAARPIERIEQWLLDLSETLGVLVPQSTAGKVMAHIRDEGADYRSHSTRGHQTDAELAPHSDRSDWNLLFYVRPAQNGGELSIVRYEDAARALAEADPDAHATMFGDFPFDLRVERIFEAIEWHCRPVLWTTPEGSTRGHYIRRFIADSARHAAAPALTAAQVRALDAFDLVVARLAQAQRFAPEAGDLVVVDNYRVMHARTAFHDHADAKRLALRTWIAPRDSEALPAFLEPMSGSCVAGSYRGGVSSSPAHRDRLGEPIRPSAPAAGGGR
jgi:hypothetical protein